MQQLIKFLREQSQHERKSRSSKLKLLEGIPLRNLIIVKRLETGLSRKSAHMAEETQS